MTSWQLGKALVIRIILCGLALLLTFMPGLSSQSDRLFAAPATAHTTPLALGVPTKSDASLQAAAHFGNFYANSLLTAQGADAPARVALAATDRPHITSSLVDMTEDVKAMGYPDGRKVVRDPLGHLYVAYRKKYKQAQLTAYHIFVAKSLDNGLTWQVLNRGQPIEKAGDYNQRVPAIAIDSQGIIHVVWYGKDAQHNGNEENQIKYVRSSDGGASWSAWQNIAPVTGYNDQPFWQEHPTLYIDAADTLYVAWEGRDSYYVNSSQVKLVKSVDRGKRWSTWINIAPSQGNHSRPALVATTNGDLYLLAYGRAGASQQILYTHSPDGGQRWQQWRAIAPSFQDQRHLSVDTDSQGNLHVVWRQAPDQLFGQGEARIHYARFDGERWSVPLQIAPNAPGAQTFPSIGIDQRDVLWITWSTTQAPYAFPNDAPEQGLISYVVQSSAGWSEPYTLVTEGRDIYASLARRSGVGNGAMGLIWLANNTPGKQIRFAALSLPTHFTAMPTLARTGFLGTAAISLEALSRVSLGQALTLPLQLPRWGQGQIKREVMSLLLVILVVTLYVIAKFLVARRRQLPLS